MNSFAFWQACEGALGALWRSAASRASSAFSYLGWVTAFAVVPALVLSVWILRQLVPLNTTDILGYLAIFAVIALVIRLSNNEIRASLEKTRLSERQLETERQLLEEHMTRQTQELIVTEKKRLIELKRTAEFGELSKGLFHDLLNPLSSISLYAENLESSNSRESGELIRQVMGASTRMKIYMDKVRRSLKTEDLEVKLANLQEEILVTRDVLSYKARMAGVEVIVENIHPVEIGVHPVRLYQIFLNLISNAIEACERTQLSEKTVRISGQSLDSVIITVEDNGCGIPSDRIGKIFKTPFSTKPSGTGIGLLTVYSIVTEELYGTIDVESDRNGTRFRLSIPRA